MLLTPFWRLKFIQLATFLVAALFALTAFASSLERPMSDSGKRWREQVSYTEFVHLIQTKVQEMPELEPWREYLKKKRFNSDPDLARFGDVLPNQVYFAGGGLRGLIVWLTKELQSNSYDEVLKNSRVPAIKELILTGSDRDIFLNLPISEESLPAGLIKNWDVLSGGFLSDSAKAGGSDIEKIGIGVLNPVIYDPKKALLRYFRDAHIDFSDAPEEDFWWFRGESENVEIKGNSKIALVLRHLRFLVLFSDTKVTAQDIIDKRII